MSEQILSAVHGVTTMLFGIYCSAFFLGIKPIRKNILTMFLLFLGQGLLYVIDLALFGETLANMSYPLIVHFPLVLFLSVHYKYPLISSAVSVFSAYLCCQISNWIIRFGNNRITVVLLFCADLNNNLNFCPSLSICISIYKNNFYKKCT